MYREETKTTTSPDGTSSHESKIERSTGLAELFFIPIGLTLTAVSCWLIIQIGVKISTSINPPPAQTNNTYRVRSN